MNYWMSWEHRERTTGRRVYPQDIYGQWAREHCDSDTVVIHPHILRSGRVVRIALPFELVVARNPYSSAADAAEIESAIASEAVRRGFAP